MGFVALWTPACNRLLAGLSLVIVVQCGRTASTLDAVYYAVSMLSRRKNRYRHAIVLIGETRDHGGKSKLEDVVAELGVTDTAIYSVAFAPTYPIIRTP